MNKNKGTAYGFMNCRASRGDVKWIANDVKEVLQMPPLQEGPQYVPLSQQFKIDVARGLKTEWEVQAKKKLLAFMQYAIGKGLIMPSSAVDAITTDKAQSIGNLYVLRAEVPGAQNLSVANDLADIMNQMYQSPLFQKGETFHGAIAFYDKNFRNYVIRTGNEAKPPEPT